MKLIYRVALRLSLILLPILLLWAVVFYYSMVSEINDEADDSLADYASMLIRRTLVDGEFPRPNDGSNNTYSIERLPDSTAIPMEMKFANRRVYIPEKGETEPARTLTMTFTDSDDNMYRLIVSTPTFEREDLLLAMLWHLVLLYAILMLTILVVTTLVFHFSMRALYQLLRWLDNYRPGNGVDDIPMATSTTEFKKLTQSARSTIERAEKYFERQKQFIGNASHELQTPLAVIGTRIEWLIDNTSLTEEQFVELSKIRQSLHRLSRLNRTLLLISKIENSQFGDRKDIDLVDIIEKEIEVYKEIYADKEIQCHTQLPAKFIISADESLATVLVTNLLKNAFLHSPDGGTIDISIEGRKLTISNDGETALDSERLFERFYTSGKSGSTGLGLALVKSITDHYHHSIKYSYSGGKHRFIIETER